MNYFKKILKLNKTKPIAQTVPLHVEINKLLREHDIKSEISSKYFEAASITNHDDDGGDERGENSADTTTATAAKVGNLLAEILVGELNRDRRRSRSSTAAAIGITTTGNEKVYKFMSALMKSQPQFDINLIRTYLNQSVLQAATECADLELCRLLVNESSAVDYLAEDNYRQTAFILAAKKNYFGVLKVFVDDLLHDNKRRGGIERRWRDEHVHKQVRLATYHACYSGNAEIVRFMFDMFALTTEALMRSRDDLDLELTSAFGKNKLKLSELNPLHVCCYKANFDIVEFLLGRLEDKTQVAAVVNSPINEYRDSTALEEAFKGLLMFDLNNEIDLKHSLTNTNNPNKGSSNKASTEYMMRQTKKKNYKKIINLLIENGARFSSSFIVNNGMCKLLTQVFTGPNKDADFVHFLSSTNYLFKYNLAELFVYEISPSSSVSSLSASQESLMLMITQKGMLLSDANDLTLTKANDLGHMIDEFMFKVYLLCLRVIKDYKGACLNYFIDTLVNLHYSQQSPLHMAKFGLLKEKNPEIYDYLAQVASKPLTLKSLCCRSIRNSMKGFGIDKINSLNIPNTLKYEIFFNGISKGYCINFDYYTYFLYKQLSKSRPV